MSIYRDIYVGILAASCGNRACAKRAVMKSAAKPSRWPCIMASASINTIIGIPSMIKRGDRWRASGPRSTIDATRICQVTANDIAGACKNGAAMIFWAHSRESPSAAKVSDVSV